MKRGIVLVDHGSRHEAANAVVADVAALVAARGESDLVVFHAHMEIARPTLDEAVLQCLEAGAGSIVVMPYFLGPGRHASVDIPALVARIAESNPSVEFRVSEPLGAHVTMAELVLERCR